MIRNLFLVLTFLAISLSATARSYIFNPQNKLRYAEGLIEKYYVDTVNADKIVDEAIIAMLKTLDPHSQYSNAEETRELTEPLEGNFSGIGIQFNMQTDTLYVIQTIAGGPSERVGILAGDRIILVNDSTIAGVKMKNNDIMKRLRGPKGTTVNVKVLRRGVDGLIEFNIVRDDIPIYSIDASYMVNDSTGYIRISRFAQDTDKEAKEAIKKLQKQGMKNLILDLESNGGGYMNTAVELANNFLSRNDLIVYTDGPRTEPFYFNADGSGKFIDGRVVVMVNQYSASASEIVSGALQDNDRGVIVGRRTFGKGLVQRPFPFPDGSMIRLTVSKYHTPSGRCIQKPYEDGKGDEYYLDINRRYKAGELMSADSIQFPDSLKYTTLKKHRIVYGGGGIMPDRFVALDTAFYSDYYRDLVAKGIINSFCINYIDNNRKKIGKKYKTDVDFAQKFKVSDKMLLEMIDFGEKEGVKFNEEQFARSREYLRLIIKAVIARDTYNDGSYWFIINDSNPTYREAVNIINSPTEYNQLLNP